MKQRLVGTLVVGCLALIFIPLLLDGEGITPERLNIEASPAPDFSFAPIPEPQEPALDADSYQQAATAEQDAGALPLPVPEELSEPDSDSSATAVADAQPGLDAEGLPEAFSVRLGIFAERANAEALLNRLLAADHKAYGRPVQTGQGALTGVFVGPVLTRNEAENLRRSLEQDFGLKGIVVDFSVVTTR